MSKNIISWVITVLVVFGSSACVSVQTEPVKIIDIHNSRNSLDWEGIYVGRIPSASGSGIVVQINLNPTTFELKYEYVDRPDSMYIEVGAFEWNETGNIITLDVKNFPPHYLVGENKLTQLDMEGNIITGDLADDYVLRKSRN